MEPETKVEPAQKRNIWGDVIWLICVATVTMVLVFGAYQFYKPTAPITNETLKGTGVPCPQNSSWVSNTTGQKFDKFSAVYEYIQRLQSNKSVGYSPITGDCAEYDGDQCIRYPTTAIGLFYDNLTELIIRSC